MHSSILQPVLMRSWRLCNGGALRGSGGTVEGSFRNQLSQVSSMRQRLALVSELQRLLAGRQLCWPECLLASQHSQAGVIQAELYSSSLLHFSSSSVSPSWIV